jgi:hypothetical protein
VVRYSSGSYVAVNLISSHHFTPSFPLTLRHQHVDCLPTFSHHKALRPNMEYFFSFSSLDRLMILYSNLARSKFEDAAVVLNVLSTIHFKKVESIQKTFATLRDNGLLKNNHVYTYSYVLDNLQLNNIIQKERTQRLYYLPPPLFFFGKCWCQSSNQKPQWLNTAHTPSASSR